MDIKPICALTPRNTRFPAAASSPDCAHYGANPVPLNRGNSSKKGNEDRKILLKRGEMLKNRWQILERIGGGGFGEIYTAIDMQSNSIEVGQSASNTMEFCSSCSPMDFDSPLHHSNAISANKSGFPFCLQNCSTNGRESYTPSATLIARARQQSCFSEDAPESQDSGISLSHSDRVSAAENQIVAVKVESNFQLKQMLCMELSVLRKLKGRKNFCELLGYGKNTHFTYIVMTLQGKNLSELRKAATEKKFTMSTSLRIVCKCLDALKELHNLGYLHRDIKPSNFCLRQQDPTEICLLDFGLVRPYLKPGTTDQIRPHRASAGFRGTVRYASINAHNYQELGRHDDLWSMYYMMVEFICGQLPWSRISGKDEVKKLKIKNEPLALGERSGLPLPIATTWVKHLNFLSYYSTPNYDELRNVIEQYLSLHQIGWNQLYDWQKRSFKKFESANTFTPRYKPNNSPQRQSMQNTKRPTYYDTVGCARRLDKLGYGSLGDLKHIEKMNAGGLKSTLALWEDATANNCMATEKIMLEEEHENSDDSSTEADAKKKESGVGNYRKKLNNNVEKQDKALPTTGAPDGEQPCVINFTQQRYNVYRNQMPSSQIAASKEGVMFKWREHNACVSTQRPLLPLPPPHKKNSKSEAMFKPMCQMVAEKNEKMAKLHKNQVLLPSMPQAPSRAKPPISAPVVPSMPPQAASLPRTAPPAPPPRTSNFHQPDIAVGKEEIADPQQNNLPSVASAAFQSLRGASHLSGALNLKEQISTQTVLQQSNRGARSLTIRRYAGQSKSHSPLIKSLSERALTDSSQLLPTHMQSRRLALSSYNTQSMDFGLVVGMNYVNSRDEVGQMQENVVEDKPEEKRFGKYDCREHQAVIVSHPIVDINRSSLSKPKTTRHGPGPIRDFSPQNNLTGEITSPQRRSLDDEAIERNSWAALPDIHPHDRTRFRRA